MLIGRRGKKSESLGRRGGRGEEGLEGEEEEDVWVGIIEENEKEDSVFLFLLSEKPMEVIPPFTHPSPAAPPLLTCLTSPSHLHTVPPRSGLPFPLKVTLGTSPRLRPLPRINEAPERLPPFFIVCCARCASVCPALFFFVAFCGHRREVSGNASREFRVLGISNMASVYLVSGNFNEGAPSKPPRPSQPPGVRRLLGQGLILPEARLRVCSAY